MLNQLDSDMDDAGEKMNFVLERLGKLLKTKDGCQLWTIVILVIVLIILGKFYALLPNKFLNRLFFSRARNLLIMTRLLLWSLISFSGEKYLLLLKS